MSLQMVGLLSALSLSTRTFWLTRTPRTRKS